MKSIFARARQKLNKKGQVINTATVTLLSILGLIITAFIIFFLIAVLNPASFFTAGSAQANSTNALVANSTEMVSQFSQRLPTVGLLLGLTLLIAVFLIIFFYIQKIRQAGVGGGGGGL